MAPSHPSPRRGPWGVLTLLAILAVCGYVGWRYMASRAADAAVDPSATARQAGPLPIPVTFSRVELTDFPVYLNGLGTVQAYNTVTARSRVDGEIIKIAFKQGQIVKEGDLLVQLDPRPFQAALDQADAKKAQDEANLKNAQLDLKRYRPRQPGLRLAPAARHATGDGRSVHRPDQRRSGSDRQRQDPAQLHDDQSTYSGRSASAWSTRAISSMPRHERDALDRPSCNRFRWFSPRPRRTCRGSTRRSRPVPSP